MKKIMILAVSLVAALCACTKQELAPAETSSVKQIITATVNAGTKVAYTDADSKISSVWEAGDSFMAIQDGTKVVTFTLSSGAGSNVAEFTAETEGVTADTKWIAVLGKGSDHTAEIHCAFMNQKGTIANLDDFAYVKADATGLTPSFNFNEGTKLSYILRIKLPVGVKCIEYTPCGWMKVMSEEVTPIYYNSQDENDYSKSKTSTITLDASSAAGDFVYIALPLLDFSRDNFTYNSGMQSCNYKAGVILTLLNDTTEDATASNGILFEKNLKTFGGKIGTIDLSAMPMVARPKVSDAVKFTKDGGIQCKLHNEALTQKCSAVETYWAPYNVGATKPSEAGMYFAWGEWWEKSEYTFPSYTLRHKHDNNNNNDCLSLGFMIGGTKYGYTLAGTRHDIARIKWGIAWRMPHMIEVYSASNGRTSWDNVDGVSGVRFTDGANSIFVPNSRYKDGSGFNSATSSVPTDDYDCARFWSADQLARSKGSAGWNEVFTFGTAKGANAEYDWWRRQAHLGFPVRPVLASSTITP